MSRREARSHARCHARMFLACSMSSSTSRASLSTTPRVSSLWPPPERPPTREALVAGRVEEYRVVGPTVELFGRVPRSSSTLRLRARCAGGYALDLASEIRGSVAQLVISAPPGVGDAAIGEA